MAELPVPACGVERVRFKESDSSYNMRNMHWRRSAPHNGRPRTERVVQIQRHNGVLKVAHPAIGTELLARPQGGSELVLHLGIQRLGRTASARGVGARKKTRVGSVPHHLCEIRRRPRNRQETCKVEWKPLVQEGSPPLYNLKLGSVWRFVVRVKRGERRPASRVIVRI